MSNYVLHHNHSYYSNLRLTDAIASPRQLLEVTHKYKYKGLSITEHESLSSSVEILQEMKKMKESGEIGKSTRLIHGNEIYLVESLSDVKDNYQSGVTKFPHYVLMAKNRKGFEALCLLSTQAHKNAFYTGGMERVPTEKSFLREVVQSEEYRGTLMASSACLGAPQNIHLLKLLEEPDNSQHYDNAVKEVQWSVETFGKEDYFIELQPADTREQRFVNEQLLKIAKELGLTYIVAGDTHFINREDAKIHSAFLNSKNEEREVESFYKYCYAHSPQDMHEQMDYYLGEGVVNQALENTNLLYNKTEDYELEHSPIIPKSEIPEFQLTHMFEPAYDKYPSLKRLAYSNVKDEQFMLHLLEEGYKKELHKTGISREEFHTILARLDVEMEEILGVGDRINQTVSSYYITVRDIVNTIWQEEECYSGSLVGSGRGSSGGFLSLFLLGITQVNPLEHKGMIHHRHLHKSREDFPDVDIDIESKKRQEVIQALKRRYGEDRVLNVATFTTAGTRNSIKIAARGLGIEDSEAQYIAGMVPIERGQQYSLNDCLYGNEDKGRVRQTQFINEINKHGDLLETALGIETIVTAKSQHAGGVIIFNEDIHKHSAMMTAAKGKSRITQWSLADSEYMGLVKFDLLSVDNLDRIRVTLELLEEDGKIENKGSLKETFDHYLHPRVLDKERQDYFDLASTGDVLSFFQFNTLIAQDTLKKAKPQTFEQFSAANSLMRLQAQEGKEPPLDTFVRHKEDINTWYQEMEEFGLTKDEQEIIKKHTGYSMGVSTVQEQAMALSADKNIAGFTVPEQNKLRKAIAKPKGAALQEVKDTFYEKGKRLGTSKNLLNYVWETQFTPMFSYAFSSIHSNLYSIIGLQNLHLNIEYHPIYWQTACLNVDAGTIDGDSIDYAKIGAAIGKMQSQGVNVGLPSINKSKLIFTPDAKTNTIMYGLGAIKTINLDIANQLINLRPFNSLQDFLERAYESKVITNTHLIALVKSGALDEFGERKQVMMEVIKYITPLKTSYTLASVTKLLESGVLKSRPERAIIELRESFKGNVLRKITTGNAKTPHKVFKVTDMKEYDEHGTEEAIINITNNYYEVDEKIFKKHFEKETKELKEWLKSDEAVNRVNRYELNEQWKKYALGTYSAWEMETLTYYFNEHELANVNKERYGLSNYSELPSDPVIESTRKWGDRDIHMYSLTQIAVTVISKDDTRHTINAITQDGDVVTVKYQGGTFSHYSKQIKKDGKIVSPSWFTRGNKLLITGYRRGGQFVAKVYKHSVSQHTTKLITHVTPEGALYYDIERESN